MKRNIAETILGAVVILIAVSFLVFSYRVADIGASGGYQVTADFAGTGGLKPGDDVVVSGVKVGHVEKVDLVPDTYLARVYLAVDSDVKLPTDTAALISSESLLGGRYLALEPGADEEIIPAGGRIEYTQAPQNLEQLLGQFIFSMNDGKKNNVPDSAPAPAAIPENKPEFEPHIIPEVVAPPAEETESPDASPEAPAMAPDPAPAVTPDAVEEPAHP